MSEPIKEFRVLTSGAFTAALVALTPSLESVLGKRVIAASTSIGIGESYIPTRLKRGEIADLVIVADDVLRDCVSDGLVLAAAYTPLVISLIGMAVRQSAPKPDISTVEAFRQTLLNARSIAYSASVSGRYLTTELYQRLHFADAVSGKGRLVGNERIGAVIARGEAEIGFEQISELMPVPGIAHIPPLPDALQKHSTFSVGVAARCPDISVAHRAIAFLTSPAAENAIRESGLLPVRAAA